jgi:peroxiredoxin Q/BCP
MGVKIGDKIPERLGIDSDGNEVLASDYKGKKLVLYFYPKDNTSGCTAEACSLSNGYEDLLNAGYAVVGVSKDSVDSHRKFRDKYSLPFKLVADTDLVLNQTFGVWQEKKMCGKVYMGTVRTTFVTDENGVITHIIKKVNTKDAATQILEELK